MTHALLKGALPIYARMLAESCGVQVEFGHAIPKTDGVTIFLPDLPVDDPISKALAFGLIMHEAGHVTETAFSVWPKNPVVADMVNRLEDIRMEGCQIRKYPGGRQRLAMMVDGLVSTGYFGSPAGELTPNEAMAAFVLYRLRANVLGQQAVAQYADIAEEQCRKLLPEPAVTRLDVLMHEVTSCRSTADVVTLATEIVKMLEEEQKKAEEEQNPSNQPEHGQPDPQDQSGSASGGTGDQQGDPAQQNASNQPQQGQSGNQDQAGSAAGDATGQQGDPSKQNDPTQQQGAGAGSGAPDPAKKAENLKNILSGQDNKGMVDVGDQLKEALGQIGKQRRYESIQFPKSVKAAKGYGDASEMLARVAAETRALRRRLSNELEAVAQSHRRIGRTGTRLATNRLYRLETMNPRVFERVEQGIAVNTAVTILIDASGSMSSRITLAVDAALGLYSALDKLYGVSAAVATFPAYVDGSEGVKVIADFNDTLRTRADCFTGVSATGGTPLAEAMLWAGSNLVPRKEERKILFICTDGEPNNGEKVKQMKQMLEEEGVEIMCLGIGHDAHDYFPDSRTIHSIAEMPHAVFQMMQRKLLRQAA